MVPVTNHHFRFAQETADSGTWTISRNVSVSHDFSPTSILKALGEVLGSFWVGWVGCFALDWLVGARVGVGQVVLVDRLVHVWERMLRFPWPAVGWELVAADPFGGQVQVGVVAAVGPSEKVTKHMIASGNSVFSAHGMTVAGKLTDCWNLVWVHWGSVPWRLSRKYPTPFHSYIERRLTHFKAIRYLCRGCTQVILDTRCSGSWRPRSISGGGL